MRTKRTSTAAWLGGGDDDGCLSDLERNHGVCLTWFFLGVALVVIAAIVFLVLGLTQVYYLFGIGSGSSSSSSSGGSVQQVSSTGSGGGGGITTPSQLGQGSIPVFSAPTTSINTVAANAVFSFSNTANDATGTFVGQWIPDTISDSSCFPSFASVTLPNGHSSGSVLYTPCGNRGDYLDMGGLVLGDSFTWQVWLYPQSWPSSAGYCTVLATTGSVGQTGDVVFYAELSSGTLFGEGNMIGQNVAIATYTSATATDLWMHLAATYTASTNTVNMYFNGQAVTSGASGPAATYPGSIKNRLSYAGPFSAALGGSFQGYSWMLIVNITALSPAQILASYNAQRE